MRYEWDPDKAKTNRQKHGVSFADAIAVFKDDYAVLLDDDYPDEDRFILIGMDNFGRILVVVHTWRGEQTIRIISARPAIRRERTEYEEGQL